MPPDIDAVQQRGKKRRPPPPELVDLVARFREAMKEAGYDPDGREQTKLANAAGLEPSTISRLLACDRLPKLPKLQRLAVALSVNPGWLAFGAPPKRLITGLEEASGARIEHLIELLERQERASRGVLDEAPASSKRSHKK
jgi:transcriptional regulator with XRE-family HTH domain